MMTFVILLAAYCIGAVSAQKLPLSASQRCNLVAQGGKACRPDACQNATCTIFPDAVCFSDRCGCRAQFYQFVKEEDTFACFTKLCQAATEMTGKDITRIICCSEFSPEIPQQRRSVDEDYLENPAIVLEYLWKDSSNFVNELMQSIVSYLKKLAEREPSDANLQRYQTALGKLNGTITQPINNATMSDTSDVDLALAGTL